MPTKNVTLNSLNFKVSNCTDRNVFLTSLAILLVTSLGPLHVTRTPRLWLFLTSNDRGSIKVTADLNYLVPVSFEFTHLEKIALAVNSDYPETPKNSQNNTPTHTNGTCSTCKVTVLHGIGSVMVMVVETWKVIFPTKETKEHKHKKRALKLFTENNEIWGTLQIWEWNKISTQKVIIIQRLKKQPGKERYHRPKIRIPKGISWHFVFS